MRMFSGKKRLVARRRSVVISAIRLGRKMRLQRFNGVARLVLAAAVSAVSLLAVGAASATKVSTLYSHGQPGTYTWKVPGGVKNVTVDVYGAAGADQPSGGVGGLGGEATATLSVQAGQVFEIVVGGQGGSGSSAAGGTGGFNGGGAGGYDTVATPPVGGGGGGGA